MTARRAVLFDVGGTLVEARAETPGARLATALGDPATARTIDALVLRQTFASPRDLATRLATELGLSTEPVAAVTDVWDEAASAAVEIDGATTCITAVQVAGAQVGILANLWTPAVEGFRAGCPAIVSAVDGWFPSCEQGSVKPGAAIFHAALAALEVKPTDALVVGDDLTADVAPALALGMSAVWLRRDDPRGASVVAVDPHAAPFPVPADVVPEGAVVARSLSDVRRIVLTWLWAARGGRAVLTAPLAI